MLIRTATAAVGLAVLLGGLWGGLPWVFLITCLAAVLGIREFYRLHPPETRVAKAGARPAGAELAAGAAGNDARESREAGGEESARSPDQDEPIAPQACAAGEWPANPAAAPFPGPPEESDAAVEQLAVPLAPGSVAPPPPPTPFTSAPTSESQPPTLLPAPVGAAWAAAFVIGGAGANSLLQFWAISLGVFVVGAFVALLWLIAFYRGPRWPVAVAYLMGGPVYVGFLLAHVMALAQVGDNFFLANPLDFDILQFPVESYELGRNWLLFALVATFATDTGAYLVGRAIGRRPMAPGISPNKTWEGAAGGFVAAALAALLLERTLNLGLGLPAWTGNGAIGWAEAWNWQPLLIGATVGIVSQGGDLLESRLKRMSQVKDAGLLMPGHGGILDRLDSLLIAIPVVYYLLVTVLRL